MFEKRKDDYVLLFTVIGLVLFGIIMVFSASYYTALNSMGDAYYYLKRELMWAAASGAAMFVTMKLPYKFYSVWGSVILVGAIILLIVVLTPLGTSINSAQRWIKIGSITIMPGELAKMGAIIFASKYLSEDPTRVSSLKWGTLPMWLLMGVLGGLIILQPNFSTAITVCAIVFMIMIASGMKKLYLGLSGALAGVAAVVAVIIEPYRLTRITTFANPFADMQGTGFQTAQSLIALGSGGLTGVGLGKSIQKMLYLPEPMNDFIFSIIGEELGYLGCILLMILYAVFIWRGIKIALDCRDNFGTLLATGITGMVAFQVIGNIAVVTNSVPNTGMSLPFISWGGNSLLVMMAGAGILMNISRNTLSVEERLDSGGGDSKKEGRNSDNETADSRRVSELGKRFFAEGNKGADR